MPGSNTSPFMLDVSNMVDERIESAIFRAVVTEITADSVRIKRVGAELEDAQDYAAVDIYPFPGVDDEVLVLKLGKGYTVLGRIVRSGLDVLHTQLGDLEVTGTLTIGAGGIETPGGSRFDDTGIRLVADGFIGDQIILASVGSGGLENRFIITTEADGALIVSTNLDAAGLPSGWSLMFREDHVELGRNSLGFNVIGPGNISVWEDGIVLGQTETAPNFGGGSGTILISGGLIDPTTNPGAGRYLLYVNTALRGRGASGTVTTIGPAEPHCQDCGRDFALEWENEKYGKLAICMWCLTDKTKKGIIERTEYLKK